MVKDETGNRYGRLTVISRSANYRDGSAQWACKCDCGAIVVHKGAALRRGVVVSCGCYRIELGTKHRMCFTTEYKSWQGMKDRCNNPKSKDYPMYGGRGITVCDSWAHSFERFYADMGPKPFGYSIDRIDNAMGYSPGNCRWATNRTQSTNRRSTRFITIGDETLSISDWARRVGITHEAFAKRLSLTDDPAVLLAPKRRR